MADVHLSDTPGLVGWRHCDIEALFHTLPMGRIYIFNREGVTHVIAPGKTFRKLADNKLAGQVMASPAAVDGAFFIRTDKGLVKIAAGRR